MTSIPGGFVPVEGAGRTRASQAVPGAHLPPRREPQRNPVLERGDNTPPR